MKEKKEIREKGDWERKKVLFERNKKWKIVNVGRSKKERNTLGKIKKERK